MRKLGYKVPLEGIDVFLAFMSGIGLKTYQMGGNYTVYPENKKPYSYSVFIYELGEKRKYKVDRFFNRLYTLCDRKGGV